MLMKSTYCAPPVHLIVLPAKVYDSVIGGTDNLEVDAIQWLGTAILSPGTAGTPDVNAKLIGGTAQTGRDIGASVLVGDKTGFSLANGSIVTATFGTCTLPETTQTAKLAFTVANKVDANLHAIHDTALTEGGAGYLAGAFVKFFNKQTPTGTINSLPDAAPGASGGLVIAGSNAATTFASLTCTGALTAGSNAVPWNSAWDAEVESEVNDALVVLRLDHLVAIADNDDVVDSSIVAKLASKGATPDWSSYTNTTDSLEAIRDRGDAAWIGGAGWEGA
jgi:hypothetical protein